MVAKEDIFFAQGVKALNKESTHGQREFKISSGELRNLLRQNGGRWLDFADGGRTRPFGPH